MSHQGHRGWGGGYLLQNDHGVLYMPVQKMDPHRRPRRRSSRASLNRAAPHTSLGRECHAVRTRFFPRGRGFPTPYLLCQLPMLCRNVPCYQSSCHLLPTLPALHPSPIPLPLGGSLSCHPSPVRRLRLGTRRLEFSADYSECLPGISPQAHPIEQADQGTKYTLEPSWVRRCNHDIFRVEEGIMMPNLLSTLAPLFREL